MGTPGGMGGKGGGNPPSQTGVVAVARWLDVEEEHLQAGSKHLQGVRALHSEECGLEQLRSQGCLPDLFIGRNPDLSGEYLIQLANRLSGTFQHLGATFPCRCWQKPAKSLWASVMVGLS